jgi:hypothetical protein
MKCLFEKTLGKDIEEALKPEVSLPTDELQSAVRGILARAGAPVARQIPALLRIEYEVFKLNSNRVRRTLAIALRKEEGACLKKIMREMPWEDVPSEIRGEFIKQNKSTLVYSLYNTPNG